MTSLATMTNSFEVVTLVLLTTTTCFGFYVTYTANSLLREISINKQSGDIYVGGRNILVYLESNLTLKASTKLGPVEDGPNCEPLDVACSTKRMRDNDVDVLLWLQAPRNKLLVCGTAHQGLCALHNGSDIDDSNNACYTQSEKHGKYSLIGASTNTLLYPFKVNNTQKFLVTHTWDQRDQQYFFEEFASLELRQDSNTKCWEFRKMTLFSSSALSSTHRMSTEMKFLYSFDMDFGHGNGSYLYSLYTRAGLTRVVRICKHDKYFWSLTEYTLKCNSYNIATSAFYSRASKSLYVAFGLGVGDSVHEPTDQEKATVCKYTMVDLHNKFLDVVHKCYSSGKGYSPPRWKNDNSNKSCKEKHNIPMKDFCGTFDNPGIDSDYVLNELHPVFQWSSGLLTSVYHHGNSSIQGGTLFMTTNYGYLIKVDETSKKKYAQYDISGNRSVQVEPRYDVYHDKIYLLSGKKVSRFPLHSCRIHVTCGACVTSNDPLGCGWCRDKCVEREECSNSWYNTSCPPIINDVMPVTGPLEGSTRITILGENFGTRKHTLEVTIGKAFCNVTEVNDSRILCETPASNLSQSFRVTVNITQMEMTPKYSMYGPSEMQNVNFTYLKPVLRSFCPDKAPKKGNTRITIQGENLNIGATATIRVADILCKIVSRSSNNITCLTSEWYKVSSSYKPTEHCVDSGKLELTIDGNVYVISTDFCIMENPKIFSMSPMKSIISGGIQISIHGENFDAVTAHILQVNVSDKTIKQECDVMTTELMRCKMPKVNTTGERTLTGHVSILLDEETFFWRQSEMSTRDEFTIYPDPEFEVLDSSSEKVIEYERKLLELRGKNLNFVFKPRDLDVHIGKIRCPVRSLTADRLTCNLEYVFQNYSITDGKYHRVKVSGGNYHQSLGKITFSHVRKDSLRSVNNVVMISGGIGFILILILVFLVCMYINHIGPFQRKARQFDTEVSYHRDARQESPVSGHLHNLLQEQQRIENEPTSTNDYSRVLLEERQAAMGGDDTAYSMASTIDLLQKQNLLINGDHLRLGSNIGKGNFGCVYKGYLKRPGDKEEILVAVKTILRSGNSDVNAFLNEALMMKDFRHPNILSLIGISLESGEFPVVVLPLMTNGDLLSYIRNSNNLPTVKDLVGYGLDIARGMEYLASIKFVHRDLAARNCMMDADFTVKVADFGLSRDIYSKEYYSSDNKKKLPIKWMAPESIEIGTCTVKSDVWSYGVVLWELMTRGASPYGEVDNWDMTRFIKKGRRLPRPEYCPVMMYQLMLRCWEIQPRDRPNFTEIIAEIEALVVAKNKVYMVSDAQVDLGKCTNYHYTDQEEPRPQPSVEPSDQGIEISDLGPLQVSLEQSQRLLSPQLSTVSTASESAALIPQTE